MTTLVLSISFIHLILFAIIQQTHQYPQKNDATSAFLFQHHKRHLQHSSCSRSGSSSNSKNGILLLLPAAAHEKKTLNHSPFSCFAKKYNKHNVNNQNSPGSELFPAAGSSYVPSGLTEQQWKEIKRKERQEIEKKDFGAWGPRFAKSERPDGDWMVIPSLWTRGFNTNPINNGNVERGTKSSNPMIDSSSSSSRSRIWKQLKSTVPIHVMSYILLECILACFHHVHKNILASSLFTIIGTKFKQSSSTLAPLLALDQLLKFIFGKLVISAIVLQPSLKLLITKVRERFQWNTLVSVLFVSVAIATTSLSLSKVLTLLFFRV